MKKQRPRSATPRAPAAERSIELMLCLAGQQGASSLQELTARVGFSKSTVHRLMGRLERIGVAERDPLSRRYRIGPRLRNAMREAWNELDPRRAALPLMERLRDLSGETVSLHVRDGVEHVVVEKCEGQTQVRRVIPIGHRWPMVRGASAKVMLAYLPPEEASDTIAKAAQLAVVKGSSQPSAADLRNIRKAGYAFSQGEITSEVISLAAPVFDHRGRVWGSVALSGPAYRFTRNLALGLAPAVVATAAEISMAFGYVAPPRQNGGPARD